MATIRDICEARGLPHTCEDSWGGDIVNAATLHLAATVKPTMLEAVWTASNYIEQNYDPEHGITMHGAEYILPTGPGLGISPDENRIGSVLESFS